MPGGFGEWFVVEVAFEEAGRSGGVAAGADHYLAVDAGRHGAPFVVDHVEVVEGVGDAHRAGAGLNPGESAHGEGCFGLAEALAQLYAGEFFPFLEHRWVEGFSGDGAAGERGEVVAADVFADEEAEHGGRRAEGGDVVAGHYGQEVGGHEFVEVVYEDVGAADPLAVELAPDGFTPSGVGQGEVEVAWMEVMPEAGGDDVAQRIGEIVGHHLWFAGGAGGEVDEHRVGVGVGVERPTECGGFLHTGVEVEPSFGQIGT